MKYVYFFGAGKTEGDGSMKDLLGGKGAGLAEMTQASESLPVPAGFTITTECCDYYLKHANKKYPSSLAAEVKKNVWLSSKRVTGKETRRLRRIRSWSACDPALARSMPGMMETILNLGLEAASQLRLWDETLRMKAFAWDAYRRFVQMYSVRSSSDYLKRNF